jgi:uncharacterized protein YchJ
LSGSWDEDKDVALSQSLVLLGQTLAGEFTNRAQALAEPTWYVHLRIWMRPVPLFSADSWVLFIEQASAAFAQPPYRQRVLRLRHQAGNLTAQYYALKSPSQFQGAAQNAQQLQQMQESDLLELAGSTLWVTIQETPEAVRFEARHQGEELCQFTIADETKWVQLGFDAIAPSPRMVQPAQFWMYDKGIDPETGKALWGALSGPFQLVKNQNYSAEFIQP